MRNTSRSTDSKGQSQSAKRILESRREALLSKANADRRDLGNATELGTPRTLGGDIDDAVYALERDISLSNAERHVAELAAIDRAIRAIEAGSWGVCEQCGLLIEADRLLARPESIWCIDCKKNAEHRATHKDVTPSI